MNELLAKGSRAVQAPVQSHSSVIPPPTQPKRLGMGAEHITTCPSQGRESLSTCSTLLRMSGSHLTPGLTEQGGKGICSQATQLTSHRPGLRPHCTCTKVWTCVRQSGKSQSQGRHKQSESVVGQGGKNVGKDGGSSPASIFAFPQSGITPDIQ